MWDERYSTADYAYGTKPNQFLQETFRMLPKGKILSLAEGEGRNAVFLAQQGYEVTAVDSSRVGLSKAKKLADENGVNINFVQADLATFDMGIEQWDGIVSIFCPMPSSARKDMHRRVVKALKNGGVFFLEAYTPDQLKYGTGGGTSVDTMTTKNSLLEDLQGLTFAHLLELEREVVEGKYHTGVGAVVQVVAVKN